MFDVNTVECRYNTDNCTQVVTLCIQQLQWHALDRYELTAGAPCPALTGEPWDIYYELNGDNVCTSLFRDLAVSLLNALYLHQTVITSFLYPLPNVVRRGVYQIRHVSPAGRRRPRRRLWTEGFSDVSLAVFAPICLKYRMIMSFGSRKKSTKGIIKILRFTILAEFLLSKMGHIWV